MIKLRIRSGLAAFAILLAAGASHASSAVPPGATGSFSLIGPDASVEIAPVEFRSYSDTATPVSADGLQPYLYRYGSQFRSRPDALVPLLNGAALLRMTNPQIQSRFAVNVVAGVDDSYSEFDEIVFCPTAASRIEQCATARQVRIAIKSKSDGDKVLQRSGHDLARKVFGVVERTGAATVARQL